MKKLSIALLLTFSTLANAQQQQPQSQSVAIDRISGSLAQCISKAEQQFDELGNLRNQLIKLQERIKELEKDKK